MAWFGQSNGMATESGISRQRAIANALMQQAMDASPVQHWTQGLARVLAGGLGGYQGGQADEAAAKMQRQKELEAATEKAKAEAEKRNTPDLQWVAGEGFFNVNPHMLGPGSTPLQVSRASRQKDDLTAWQKYQLERQQRLDEANLSKRRTVNVDGVPYYEDTKEPVIPNSAAAAAEPEFKNDEVRTGEFSRRMVSANDAIDTAMQAGADPTRTWLGGNVTSDDSRWNSAEWQQYKQAKDAFILAGLRKDTGASISEREYAEMDRTYFPQPGDKPEVVAQKAAARKQLQADLAAASGGAFDYMEKKNPRSKGINTLQELNTQLQEGQTATDTQTGKKYTKRNGQIVEVPQ